MVLEVRDGILKDAVMDGGDRKMARQSHCAVARDFGSWIGGTIEGWTGTISNSGFGDEHSIFLSVEKMEVAMGSII